MSSNIIHGQLQVSFGYQDFVSSSRRLGLRRYVRISVWYRSLRNTNKTTKPDSIRTAGLSTTRLSIPRPARRNSEPGLPSPLLPKPAQWDWWESLPTYSEDGSTSI